MQFHDWEKVAFMGIILLWLASQSLMGLAYAKGLMDAKSWMKNGIRGTLFFMSIVVLLFLRKTGVIPGFEI